MQPANPPALVSNRYQLGELIGKGGMGSVHRAYDRLNGQTVALKRVVADAEVLDFSTSYDLDDFRLGLAHEFKLLASLRHPNVITVLDYGFDEDRQPFYTMEVLEDASTVLEAAKDQPLKVRVELIVQVLHALAYLHHRGILHRDIKPANILVVDGQVKVLDFGLSSMREHIKSDTAEDNATTAGTLTYMAPEVLMGHHADERGDLYSIGMIAYEIFAGFHPFGDSDIANLVNHILYTEPDITALDISESLAVIVSKLLHKERDNRYTSAKEVIVDLSSSTDFDISKETVEIRESFLQAARLVGRSDELQTLTSALANAISKRGSAWLLAGESGVGKSRLIDELRTQAMVDGALVMRGQAVAEGGNPYEIWRMVLRWISLLTNLSDTDASIVKLIAPEITGLSDSVDAQLAQLEPHRVQTNLLRLLDEVLRSQERSIVITLEDLHWSSKESLALLSHLSGFIDDLPLLIVASFRDDEHPNLPDELPDIPLLKLNRLPESDIAELSQAMLGEVGAQPQVVNLLQRETEGNVFFIIEVVRALAEEAGELEQIGKMTLPPHVFAGGVQLIIQRRLQRLPDWTHRPLQYAALIGRRLNVDLLVSLELGVNIDQWLIECVNSSVFETQDSEFYFAHDRLRESILADVPPEFQQKLHRQIAESLTTLSDEIDIVASLAYHWGKAGDIDKETYYVARVGQQASRSGAFQEAISAFDRALKLLKKNDNFDEAERDKQLITLQNAQAEAYLGLGQYETARHIYRKSLLIAEQVGAARLTANSLNALGDVSYALNTPGKAREYYQESLTIYRELDEQAGVARTLNSLGNIAYDQGDHNIAKQLYQQSMVISREIGGQWGMAGSLIQNEDDTNAMKTKRQDDVKRLTAELDVALGDKDQEQSAEKLNELGKLATDAGNHEAALQHYTRALVIHQEVKDIAGEITVRNQIALSAIQSTDLIIAAKNLRRALQSAVDNDLITAVLQTLLNIARLRIAEDKNEHALEVLAFILNHNHSPPDVEDEAERMIFELENTLASAVVESIWERGKENTLKDILRNTLSIG